MALRDFIATIKENGLIRSNRFTVTFDLPAGFRRTNYFSQYALRTMMIMCNKATLPGISLSTAPTRTFGEVRNIPYERNFEPISLSFYADRNMGAKYFFDEWINLVQNRSTRTFTYYDEYTIPQLTVEVQDVDDNPVYSVVAYNAYPKTVSAIEVSSGNSDLLYINVVFEYQYWKSTQSEIEEYQDPNLIPLGPGQQFITIQGSSLPGIGAQLAQGISIPFTPGITSTLSKAADGLSGDFSARIGDLNNVANTVAPGSFDTGNTSLYNSILTKLTNGMNGANASSLALSSPSGLNIPPANLGELSALFNAARLLTGNASALASVLATCTNASGVTDLATKLGNIDASVGPAMASVANVQNKVSQLIQISTNALSQLGTLAPNQLRGQ